MKPSLDEIFSKVDSSNEATSSGKPSLDQIFSEVLESDQQASQARETDITKLMGNDPSQNEMLSGLPAAGVEVARGLGKGTGQMVASAGFLLDKATLGAVPQVQDFGNKMIAQSEALPETDMGGFAKGALNLAGEFAPMMATFGAGEAIGLAKLGESAVRFAATASKSPRVAGYITKLARPMGQGTLFATVNAIDTASTLPETMEFNDKVRTVAENGAVGFIAGATLTPIMEHGFELLRKHGSNAAKMYFTNILGNPEAAEKALDLARVQGSYPRLKVDPSKPMDQRISFETTKVGKLSPLEIETQHNNILRAQEAEIGLIKDKHLQMSRQLEDDIRISNQTFDTEQRRISSELEEVYRVKGLEGDKVIQSNLDKVGKENFKKLDELSLANSQRINKNAEAFQANTESAIDFLGKDSGAIYKSVISQDPAAGFEINSVIAKIQKFLSENHGVRLSKKSQMPEIRAVAGRASSGELPPQILAQLEGQVKKTSKWSANTGGVTGKLPPEAANLVEYLAPKKGEGFLSRLEKIASENDGKISLDMLRREMQVIDGNAWQQGRLIDKGFADLYGAIRPNQLIGDIKKLEDAGAFRGSDAALKELKIAAMQDDAFSKLKKSYGEIKAEILSNPEAKAKTIRRNSSKWQELREFEDAVGLAADSPVRMTNAIEAYNKSSENLLARKERLSDALSTALKNQKARLGQAIRDGRFRETEETISRKFSNKETIISQKRAAIDAKSEEVKRASDFMDQLKESIKKEKLARDMARHEMSMLSRADTAFGRLQRGSLMMSGMGVLSGSPHLTPALGLTLALAPRFVVTSGRVIKRGLANGALRRAMDQVQNTGKSKIAQRLLISNLLRQRE